MRRINLHQSARSPTYLQDRPQWIQGGAEMQMIRDAYPLAHLSTARLSLKSSRVLIERDALGGRQSGEANVRTGDLS